MDELARKICEDLYEAFPAGMLLDGTGEEIVNTHLATLRALASSRAGDMATLLAENAALRAECEAAADLIVMKHEPESYFARSHCDFCGEDLDEHAETCKYLNRLTAYQQARATRQKETV